MTSTKWLHAGSIGRAHGLRGAFFLSHRDDVLPPRARKVRVGPNLKEAVETEVLRCQWQSGRPVAQLAAFDSREAVRAVVGHDLWIRRQDVDTAPDEYVWADLIGLPVIDADGVELGKVDSLYNNGANDVVVLRDAERGLLDIALVPDYIDLEFKEPDQLTLVVPAAMFDDFWQAPRSGKAPKK